MFSRISSVCLALSCVACGDDRADEPSGLKSDDRIECATAGAAGFARTCAVERGGGGVLILRHADGGFRRITIADDGTVGASDGSALAGGKALADGRFELRIGDDRYRLPPRP